MDAVLVKPWTLSDDLEAMAIVILRSRLASIVGIYITLAIDVGRSSIGLSYGVVRSGRLLWCSLTRGTRSFASIHWMGEEARYRPARISTGFQVWLVFRVQ